MNKQLKILTLIAAMGLSGATLAAPIATLTFNDPMGIVGPTDSIPVYVTLALDPSSTPIITDPSGTVTSGYSAVDLPAGFQVTSSNLNNSFACSGTFTTGCGGPPYDWNFAFGSGAFTGATNLALQPGTSTTFLFGTFTPTNNQSVAPGTYTFYDAAFFIQLWDYNNAYPNTGNTPWHVDVQIASTCSSQAPACSFQRTVVPLPATTWLFGSGLLGLIGVARRKAASLA